MLEPPHRTPTDLQPFPDRITRRLVRHNDISPLAKCRNHTAYCRKCLRVQYTCRHAQMRGDVRLDAVMYVLRAVEAWWAAGADAVSAQGSDGGLFERFGGGEVVEVVGSQVRHCAAGGELDFGSYRSTNLTLSLGG